MLSPALLDQRFLALPGTKWAMLGLAVLLVPVALLIEYGIHALASYRSTGNFPRGIGVQRFWQKGLSPADHLLLVLIAVGEEFFYRLIWIGILMALGLPAWFALMISSLGYGLNHLSFGNTSVVSKSVSGLLYGALYLLGGSIWFPVVTHTLQNFALFQLTRPRNE